MSRFTAERYHDISCGHTVYGHESKCAHLHGHNYRFHFVVAAASTDSLGRVLDFSVIKSQLCMWLEDNWDHRFLVWEKDDRASTLVDMDPTVVLLPFNPTAEKLAQYMVQIVAPRVLVEYDVELIECRVEETRKCSATWRNK